MNVTPAIRCCDYFDLMVTKTTSRGFKFNTNLSWKNYVVVCFNAVLPQCWKSLCPRKLLTFILA